MYVAVRRRLARRLEEQRRLVALVGHDMREPLAVLSGHLRELAEEETAPDRRERFKACLQAADHLVGLVNDLLDAARAEAGRLACERRPFRLDAFLGRLAAAVEPRARARDLAFALELDPTLPPVVEGDPARLRQILLNLLSNALKYTVHGHVRLLADRLPEGVRFTVEDSGRGLPASLRHANVPFRRAGAPEPGTGLGLFIARTLAHRLGGRLRFEDAAGGGTRAILELPLRPLPADTAAAGEPRGLRVLLVVVTADADALPAGLPGGAGLQLERVCGLEAARRRVEQAAEAGVPPEVLVISARRLEPAVLAFARRLRRHPALGEMRLVLRVDEGLRGDAAACRQAGFDVYLAGNAGDLPWRAVLARLAPGRPSHLLVTHDFGEVPTRPLCVLVVEDDPLSARLLALLLERLGHRVTRVASGEAALARLGEDPTPDVVLLDLQLPGMGGLEFVRRLRTHPDPRVARVPVVAVTASGLPEERQACERAGMAAFLQKPVQRGELAAALARVANTAGGTLSY